MKDYYKILGIKENASREHIRARWIELMREFHPDGKAKGRAEDRSLKEINEAYGVLKHPSTRIEYDLKMAYHRRKRRSSLRRIALVSAILIVLLISGMIYMKKPRVALRSQSTTPLARSPFDIKGNYPSYPEPTGIDELEAPKDLPIAKDLNTREISPPVSKSKPSATIRKYESHEPRAPAGKAVSQRSVADSNIKRKGMNDPTGQKDPKHTKAPRPIVKSESPVSTGKPEAQTSQASKSNDLRNTIARKEHDAERDLNERGISVAHVLIAPNTSIEVEGQTAQRKPPSLIATEDEVKQFFARYIDRYAQKDIEGFHSLFSSKAVQNGKDGFNEIRKIYSFFFEQSKALQYRLEETRIEIYQNAVHVKARYKVNQRLKKGEGKNVWRGDIHWILVRENEGLKIRYLDYKQDNSR